MKKIESPAWAPSNIGEILKKIRLTCEIYRLRSMKGQFFLGETTIGTQLYERVENGKRNISETEIRDIIHALCYVDAQHMKTVIEDTCPIAMPIELKTIIQETLEAPDIIARQAECEQKSTAISEMQELIRGLRCIAGGHWADIMDDEPNS